MNMGTMIHDSTYKLKKVDAGAKRAEIESQGKSSMKEPSGGADPATPPMLKIEKGDSHGTIQWDLEKGQMESTQTQADVATVMNIPAGKMNMTQKVQSSVKRAKLADFRLPDDKAATTQPAAP
jgi:hypothetical protein